MCCKVCLWILLSQLGWCKKVCQFDGTRSSCGEGKFVPPHTRWRESGTLVERVAGRCSWECSLLCDSPLFLEILSWFSSQCKLKWLIAISTDTVYCEYSGICSKTLIDIKICGQWNPWGGSTIFYQEAKRGHSEVTPGSPRLLTTHPGYEWKLLVWIWIDIQSYLEALCGLMLRSMDAKPAENRGSLYVI